MVLNATFNNISVMSWRSVLLVEENGVPGESHRPVASNWQTLSHNVVSSTPRHERDSNSQLQRWGTDCIGSCKSNYHAIKTTTTTIYVKCDCKQTCSSNIALCYIFIWVSDGFSVVLPFIQICSYSHSITSYHLIQRVFPYPK